MQVTFLYTADHYGARPVTIRDGMTFGEFWDTYCGCEFTEYAVRVARGEMKFGTPMGQPLTGELALQEGDIIVVVPQGLRHVGPWGPNGGVGCRYSWAGKPVSKEEYNAKTQQLLGNWRNAHARTQAIL